MARGVNGREKGKVAEREVAGIIQPWWQQLEPDKLFVRTPQSGGWQGAEVREEFQASGDLMTTAKMFPFAVEVKRREGWYMQSLLEGLRCPVWGWWDQTQKAAIEMNKQPMLWLRKNRMEWHVMMGEMPTAFCKPVRAWSRMELLRVGSWRVHPTLYLASDVLAVKPDTIFMMYGTAGRPAVGG